MRQTVQAFELYWHHMHPPAKRRAKAAAFVVFFGLLLFTSGCSDRCPLLIPEQALDLGTVWSDPNFGISLPLKNTSRTTVHVTRVAAACDCTILDQRPFDLMPGETTTLDLMFDLSSSSSRLTCPRQFSEKILVTVSDPERQFLWTVRGEVKDAFQLEPSELELTDVLLGTCQGLDTQVRMKHRASLSDLSLSVDADWLQALMRAEVQQQSRVVDITVIKELSPGQHKGKIVFTALTPGGHRVHASVPVCLGVTTDVQMMPRSRHLGVMFPGEKLTTTFQLVSLSESEFSVRSWSLEPSHFAAAEYEDSSKQLTLTLSGQDNGRNRFKVHLDIVHAQGKSEELVEQFTYVSIAQPDSKSNVTSN